ECAAEGPGRCPGLSYCAPSGLPPVPPTATESAPRPFGLAPVPGRLGSRLQAVLGSPGTEAGTHRPQAGLQPPRDIQVGEPLGRPGCPCMLGGTVKGPCTVGRRRRGMASRVVLAMSGGVDSSVAAYLLRRQGYEVIGLFMRTGAHGSDNGRADHKKGCCSAVDAGDARRVADRLDIPFYALDFEDEFQRIMDYF